MGARAILPALCAILFAGSPPLAAGGGTGETLRLAVVVCRHGVRSPMNANGELAPYAAQPWPTWPVPPTHLTPRGKRLMAILGAYYRERYVKDGLLAGSGDADHGRIFFRANNAERTVESARGLAEGLMDDGNPDVHAMPAGTIDPLFNPVSAGLGHPDRSAGAAAALGRVGGDLGNLVQAYRTQFLLLDRVLFGESAGVPAPGKIELMRLPAPIKPGAGTVLVDAPGPFEWAMRMTENLILEYEEGMPRVGWGRASREDIAELLKLHALFFDITQRTFLPAQVQASNLVAHMLDTMEQAAQGRAVPGAIGGPSERLVFILGHDTNMANLGGLLDLSWAVRGLPMNPTLPAGALAFELWRHNDDGRFFLRAYYIAPTLDQMRNGDRLTLESPPAISPISIPGCGTAGQDCEAPFDRVETRWRQLIDPRYVSP